VKEIAQPVTRWNSKGCDARFVERNLQCTNSSDRGVQLLATTVAAWLLMLPMTDACAQPDAERLHEAQKVFADMGGDELFAPFFRRLEKNIVESLATWSGRSSADVQSAVEKIIMPNVRTSNHLAEYYINEMALGFTSEELRQIDAFEVSPVGRKLCAQRPEMAQHLYDLEHDWARTSWPTLFEKHKPELAAIGIKGKLPSQ
jgi:hypothetical protein